MDTITRNSTQPQLVEFLKDQILLDLRPTAKYINDKTEHPVLINEYGSKAELIDSLREVKKCYLWEAIDDIFPDCDDEEDLDDDEEDEVDYENMGRDFKNAKDNFDLFNFLIMYGTSSEIISVGRNLAKLHYNIKGRTSSDRVISRILSLDTKGVLIFDDLNNAITECVEFV